MGRDRKKQPSLDVLVRDLYGSLAEEADFEEPLHRFGAVFRSSISGLHTEDFGAHRGRLTLVGAVSRDEYNEFTQAYSQRWNGQNLWMERSLDGFLQQGFQYGDAVVGEAELKASAYYRHFLKPLDIRHGLGICLWNDDAMNMAVASFHRGHGDVGYDADDVARIRKVRPHLSNAYAIHRRFAKLQADYRSMRSAFERAPLGMLVFDDHGAVLDHNASADRLLRSGQGMALGIDATLRFANVACRHAFNTAIISVIASAAPQPASIRVPASGDESRHPHGLILHLCAFPSVANGLVHARGRILGFLAELQPSQQHAFHCRILQGSLGLTPAEARVALALRSQPDVEATAIQLGIAPSTLRSHLKNLFAKLGIHQQSQLVLLVERLVASAP